VALAVTRVQRSLPGPTKRPHGHAKRGLARRPGAAAGQAGAAAELERRQPVSTDVVMASDQGRKPAERAATHDLAELGQHRKPARSTRSGEGRPRRERRRWLRRAHCETHCRVGAVPSAEECSIAFMQPTEAAEDIQRTVGRSGKRRRRRD